MTQKERIVLLFILIAVTLIIMPSSSEAAEELKYHLNFLPKSWHHGSTHATNERHKGVGLSVTTPWNGITYGLWHYKNSYSDNGWMVTVGKEKLEPLFGLIYPGIGVGYAPAYEKSDHDTGIAWISLRYRWVTLMSAPGNVTTFVWSVPIN